MELRNTQKLIILCVGIVCATVALILGKMSETAAVGIISGAMFYIVGNGVAARKGKEPGPVLGPKPPSEN